MSYTELGFFITEIHFNSDNQFNDKFHGDLQNVEIDGVYKIDDGNVYLKFSKIKNGKEKIVLNDTIVDFEKGETSIHMNLKMKTELSII